MNRHLVVKMCRFRVAELRHSPAITGVPRLEAEHFNRQSVRPRLNQRFPGLIFHRNAVVWGCCTLLMYDDFLLYLNVYDIC
jgi:hypothetical protein